jgi:hypothetical protein
MARTSVKKRLEALQGWKMENKFPKIKTTQESILINKKAYGK